VTSIAGKRAKFLLNSQLSSSIFCWCVFFVPIIGLPSLLANMFSDLAKHAICIARANKMLRFCMIRYERVI
jgi:hypothetical protein